MPNGWLESRRIEYRRTGGKGENSSRLTKSHPSAQYRLKMSGLTSLAHDSGITAVNIEIPRDPLPQTPKHLRTSRKMQSRELWVVDTLPDDLGWGTRDELDDRGG